MGLYKMANQKQSIIDIIILTCNKMENTRKCIESIYEHTSSKLFSLIIWDNGSIDGTPNYLKKIADKKDNITLFFNSTNIGIIKARNEAHNIASSNEFRGVYAMFLDNDQFVMDKWFDSCLKFLGKSDIVGYEGWQMREDFYPIRKAKTIEDTYHYVSGCGLIVPYYITDKIGVFEEEYSPIYFEDPSFCFRALESGYSICWNYEGKIYHEPHILLHTVERKKYFMRNWELFKDKWKDYKLKDLSEVK